ncbi:MAG TPA: hypothetical protein PK605_15465 [Ignavibacteria bacterium]|nr:hypothetical protein [Bacteroidota bacterium]HRE11287.1 hypothetical protein [Ignavibacteria bacterium]HRF67257.1 hypothetical protein [Ignavibacteria bacterium]HRJ05802.1 hypothetical protein [Ignavibacteria bacterium]
MSEKKEMNNVKKFFAPSKRRYRSFMAGFFLTAVIITVTSVVSVALTRLQDDPYGKLIERVADEIDLNDRQKSDVLNIKNDLNAKLENRKVTKVAGGKDIENLFRAESFNRSEAMRIAGMQDAENRDLAVYIVDELEKLHNLMTSTQRNDAVDKIKSLYNQMKNR